MANFRKIILVFLYGCLTGLVAAGPYRPDSAVVDEVAGYWTEAGAELVWRTVAESGTAAFRVYREGDGEARRLHEAPYIPVDITRPEGSVYRLGDPRQARGSSATYRLDELRLDGDVRTLGRWTVRFADPPPPAPAPVAPVVAPPTRSLPATGTALKIPVDRRDLFAVSFADIAAGLGRSPSEIVEALQNSALAMRCGERAVAYWPDFAGERLVFYGWPSANRYTRTNIFWLEPGAGLQMQRLEPSAAPPPEDQTFTSHERHEEDRHTLVDHGSLRDDLYYWEPIYAGFADRDEKVFTVPFDGYASGDASIVLHLIGWVQTANTPGHLAEIHFNDTFLGQVAFIDKEEVAATFTIPAEAMAESGNELKVRGIRNSTQHFSLFVVDRFEVFYRRYYAPSERPLLATAGGHLALSAHRFADPVVFEIVDPYLPKRVSTASGGLPPEAGWAVEPGTEWLFRERAAIVAVVPYPGGGGEWLLEPDTAVDYLVVAPRSFASPAERLAAYRADLGLRTAVAFYEDICDQFAEGLNTPEAIRALLAYARDNWAAAPWMVVLGGRGHYDYLGVSSTAANPLPALLAATSGGLRPADSLLVDLDGDGLPSLAVGRIPARSAAEFDAYIDKVQAYEGAGRQSWHARAFLVADDTDPGGDFTAGNLALGEVLGERYTVGQASLDWDSVGSVRAALLAAFTDGSGVVHFTGHANTQLLGSHSQNLLNVGVAEGLVNPPVPLFVALTCLAGRFDIPNGVSLGEALVRREGGGALAAYVPSSLSWNTYATQFGLAFYRLHAAEGHGAVGPALMAARRSLGALSGIFADALISYNLLGDPAVKLAGGEGGLPPGVSHYSHWRWERFTPAELADPEVSGEQADAEGRGWSNFLDYVFGGFPPVVHRSGFDPATRRFGIWWRQRRHAEDVQYRPMVSSDLRGAWTPLEADFDTAPEGASAPAMDRVEGWLPVDGGWRFFKVDVLRE